MSFLNQNNTEWFLIADAALSQGSVTSLKYVEREGCSGKQNAGQRKHRCFLVKWLAVVRHLKLTDLFMKLSEANNERQ
jgi:hypothetical protein